MNPIQPSTTQPPEISVTAPVNQAIDRVKRVLFQPFDAGKWFVIGFCAWLAHLCEQGFGGGGNFGSFGNGRNGESLRHEFEQAKDYVLGNLHWIGPLVVALVVVGLGLWVLFTWLNSRGKFMFLHCVALNTAEIAAPWRKFARHGNSLCLFRLVLGLIGSLLTLPLVALMVVSIFRMVVAGEPSVRGIALAAGAFLALLALALVFFLIVKLTTDFVVPIMFLRGTKCLAGWRELRGLLSGHFGHLILYLLFQIALAIVIGIVVFIVVIVTCCLAGCLMAIPYLGTVLLLPVLMFKRAYSLHYLAQFGPTYDVFAPTAAPTMETAPSAG
jgi:hypothetical protein